MIKFNETEVTLQTAKIKAKFDKYPEYVLGLGGDAVRDYLNTDQFKGSMYPEIPSGTPFVWSSDRQRRAYFATNGFGGGIPTRRTGNLMARGVFSVEKKRANIWVHYMNFAPYSQWVIGEGTQIIGHKTRGWLAANKYVVKYRAQVVHEFDRATNGAWDAMSIGLGAAPGL